MKHLLTDWGIGISLAVVLFIGFIGFMDFISHLDRLVAISEIFLK